LLAGDPRWLNRRPLLADQLDPVTTGISRAAKGVHVTALDQNATLAFGGANVAI
jgi:hypothetical protein